MKQKRHLSMRILALFLALAMTVTMTGDVFAVNYKTDGTLVTKDENVKYVSLGESMTNGYGLDGYRYNLNDIVDDVNGYLQVCEDAYPYLFAKWLEEYTGKTVDFQQLAISCTRAEDLNFALRFDYTNNDGKLADRLAVAEGEWNKEAWFSTFDCGDWFTWDNFTAGRWHDMDDVGNTNLAGTDNVARMYQESVADADVVSMAIGNSNFGVFMLRRVVGALGLPGMADDEEWMLVEDALRSCDTDIQEKISVLETELETLVVGMGATPEMAHELSNLAVYTISSFVVNYAQCIDRIVELNPDVTLMIMGLFNEIEGVKVKVGSDDESYLLDMGQILNLCVRVANLYLAGLPEKLQSEGKYPEAKILFVQTESVDAFTSEFAAGNTSKMKDVRYYLIGDMCSYFGLDRNIVTFENVEAFDAARNAVLADPASALANPEVLSVLSNPDNAAVAQYLGLEKMMEESCSLEYIDGNSILQIPDAMSDITPVLETLTATVTSQIANLLTTNPVYVAVAGVSSDLAMLLAMPDAMLAASKMEENYDLVNMMRVFAIFIAANGIGAHPSAKGHHETSELMAFVYENGYTVQDFMAKDALRTIMDFADRYGAEALGILKDYALANGLISEAEAALMDSVLADLEKARDEEDADAVLENCYLLTYMLFTCADKAGYVPAETANIIGKLLNLSAALQETAPEEIRTHISDLLMKFVSKNGIESLTVLGDYAAAKNLMDDEKLAELDSLIADAIAAGKGASNAVVRAEIDKIVDFIYNKSILYALNTPENAAPVVAQLKEAYFYFNLFSESENEEEIQNALLKLIAEYGAESTVYVSGYAIEQGLVSEEEAAVIDAQVQSIIAAAQEGNQDALEDMALILAKLLYAYSDANDLLPADVMANIEKAAYLYSNLRNMDDEEIKTFVSNELDALIEENGVEVLVAVVTFTVNGGWLDDADLDALTDKVVEAIAAYKLDPDAVSSAKVSDLVDYLCEKAIEHEYIEPENAETLSKFAAYFKEIGIYYVTTPEEQAKAESVAKLSEYLDSNFAKHMDEAVFEEFKADMFQLLDLIITSPTQNAVSLVDEYLNSLKAKYAEKSYAATHGSYRPLKDSFYVALGGSTVAGAGLSRSESTYAALLSDKLGIEYESLADSSLLPSTLLDYIETNSAEIAKADLITYQMDASSVVLSALSSDDPDWSVYFTEEEQAFIEEAIPLITDIISENWSQLAEMDISETTEMIKNKVLGCIDEYIKDQIAITTDNLDSILEICVAETKGVISYIQEQSDEASVAELTELSFMNEVLRQSETELSKDWTKYASMTAASAAAAIRNQISAFSSEQFASIDTERKNTLLTECVSKLLELYKSIGSQLDTLTDELVSDTVQEIASETSVNDRDRFADIAYTLILEALLDNWKEFSVLDSQAVCDSIQESLYQELTAQSALYEQYVNDYKAELDESLAPLVDEIHSNLVELDEANAEIADAMNAMEDMKPYSEKILYACIAYAFDTAKAIERIQEINPDATLLVIGMFNGLNGLKVIYDGEESDVGTAMDSLVEATDKYYTALAVANNHFTFIPVPDTQSGGFSSSLNLDTISIVALGVLALSFNSSVSATAEGHQYIYEQIMNAITLPSEPKVINYTKPASQQKYNATVYFEDWSQTAVVTSNYPCVLIAECADGSFVRLKATRRINTTYTFDLTQLEGEFTLSLALKGDYNLDGTLTAADVTKANSDLVNAVEADVLQYMVFDINGDGAVSTNDVARVNKAISNNTALSW